MRRHLLRLTTAATMAAGVTTAVTVGLLAGVASAGPSGAPRPSAAAPSSKPVKAESDLPANATLQQIQAAATTAVNARVGALNDAIGKVQKATYLGSDQAALLHTCQADVPGLQQLGQKIAADTTAPTARADYERIFTDYRVFVLVLPVSHLVAAIDRIDNTVDPRLTTTAGKISSRVTPADQAQIQPLLTDLTNQVSTAKSATAGLPATLEGYTPAQWNTNHALLADAKGKLQTAKGAVTKARADAKQAAADVRANRGPKAAGKRGSAQPSPAAPA